MLDALHYHPCHRSPFAKSQSLSFARSFSPLDYTYACRRGFIHANERFAVKGDCQSNKKTSNFFHSLYCYASHLFLLLLLLLPSQRATSNLTTFSFYFISPLSLSLSWFFILVSFRFTSCLSLSFLLPASLAYSCFTGAKLSSSLASLTDNLTMHCPLFV